MSTSALTTIPALQVIGCRENHQAILPIEVLIILVTLITVFHYHLKFSLMYPLRPRVLYPMIS